VEFVNTLAHYYRGEMSRMISWRDRIDRTTNWAITAVAAMLSLSLSTPSAHHGVLLFAMLIVYLLLNIEARRYRFFDVYRSRVRLLERSYYAHIFAPEQAADSFYWLNQIGQDLRAPRFTITFGQAMSRRLRRNYSWLFLILLPAWVLKITSPRLQPQTGESEFIHSAGDLLRNAALVTVPGWVVLTAVAAFYGWLIYLMFKHRQLEGELAHGEVHV
jgi:uncharacterized membrane protein